MKKEFVDVSTTKKLKVFRNKTFLKVKKATNEIRTRDLSLTKRVLYQLSYSGAVTEQNTNSTKTKN